MMTESRVQANFDRAATSFGQGDLTRRFPYFGERLVAAAEVQPGQQVLDVATGRGAVLFPAAQAVGPRGRVVGVDLAPGMIEATARELAEQGLSQVTVQVMDAEQLTFPEASFDAVLCGFGLMFFPHLADALQGFRRVLKPGGRLAVSTWAPPDPRFGWELKQWQAFGILDRHASRLMTQPLEEAEVVAEALGRAGFEAVEIRTVVDEVVHRDDAHWWGRLNNAGMSKLALDSLSSVERERFQTEAFAHLAPLREADGIHQQMVAHLGLARNP
jgi:ubiquinone/menaquinone biosynthesis C-methylase UbiE